MILRSAPLILCIALVPDCAWDAPPHSDFITFGAGESVARARVLQPREIWPKDSLNNDLEFEASRFVPPIPDDAKRLQNDTPVAPVDEQPSTSPRIGTSN